MYRFYLHQLERDIGTSLFHSFTHSVLPLDVSIHFFFFLGDGERNVGSLSGPPRDILGGQCLVRLELFFQPVHLVLVCYKTIFCLGASLPVHRLSFFLEISPFLLVPQIL
jgi:hypothetical protein